ncbi:hypothetical protein [Phytobacter diazotrophicus]
MFNLINRTVGTCKKQPLLFFPWLVVYSAALTFTVTLSTVT